MQLAESGSSGRRAISLTPLIDVVFILLLFFMLSTQFSQQQAMQLTVPSEAGTAPAEDITVLKLRLSVDGNIILQDKESILPALLASHTSVLSAISQAVPIQLDADDEVSLQQLILVTDLLEQAGAGTVKLTALR
ncbi:ExbD/TolR family protein [Granulosicoccus antarcticus]|uniref:Biopolymer transport protein ExbD n=1 Tax=Granulosicoccus antarcticus IMCC3135 TaxID=1192854 RepID=A0A2Z2NVD0_9GAMM|nr:biopolymer transporter ExbD [Granulosicoccus antarcticus]ASJ75203.1 hypothetical protein IMCC3135_25740 [Granulosicoccus antarcticus IMCC3135]